MLSRSTRLLLHPSIFHFHLQPRAHGKLRTSALSSAMSVVLRTPSCPLSSPTLPTTRLQPTRWHQRATTITGPLPVTPTSALGEPTLRPPPPGSPPRPILTTLLPTIVTPTTIGARPSPTLSSRPASRFRRSKSRSPRSALGFARPLRRSASRRLIRTTSGHPPRPTRLPPSHQHGTPTSPSPARSPRPPSSSALLSPLRISPTRLMCHLPPQTTCLGSTLSSSRRLLPPVRRTRHLTRPLTLPTLPSASILVSSSTPSRHGREATTSR